MRDVARRARSHLHALLVGTVVGLVIFLVSLGLYLLCFGWHRFLLDFWPLDASRVGPNLIASLVTIVVVTAHNEARVVQKALQEGETLEEIADEMLDQVIHPVETAEAAVAEQINQGESQ